MTAALPTERTEEEAESPPKRQLLEQAVTACARWWPELLVLAAVLFGLVAYRAELTLVSYLNDSAIHSQMVRYATLQLRAGHLPLFGWYPYLGLGSPQFLHYQSLGATLAGMLGLAIGPDRAFSLSLYLLVATWPVSVYLGARLFGLSRPVAAFAAACSPFIVSITGVGFEDAGYLWIGFGVWAQLWAMWTLPIAWGATRRALKDRRYIPLAALFVAATVAFHYEMGYLAVLGVIVLPFVEWGRIVDRIAHALVVGVLAGALCLWVVYPLIHFADFASINEFLQHTPDVDSYGARQVLDWLFTGHLFDQGRFPILTILAGIGFISSLVHFRSSPTRRAVLVLFVVTTILFFGRPTFGSLLDVLPGSRDLFLRRFIAGVQLSGIGLCGIGVAEMATLVRTFARRAVPQIRPGRRRLALLGSGVCFLAAFIGALTPAWSQAASTAKTDANYISYQQAADSIEGSEVDALIDRAEQSGEGRIYAGLPTNWGESFKVGTVAVVKYLAWRDVDEVGYTLRTASLMTDPEQYFDDANPADYQMFGARYLLFPFGRRPVKGALLLEQRGAYVLWELPAVHYIQVVQTVGSIAANRSDVGAVTSSLLVSNMAARGLYETVAWNGAPASPPTLGIGESSSPPGSVLSEHADLVFGEASATVRMARPGVVLLKVSYDPGWQVTVDGRPAATEMIAPALVGVRVGPGAHEVVFSYHTYGGYPVLLGIGAAALLLMASWTLYEWRRRRAVKQPAEL